MEAIDQLRTLANGIEAFELDQGRRPTLAEGLAALQHRPEAISPERWLPAGYIDASLSLKDPWGTEIRYGLSSDAQWPGLELLSAGPDGVFDYGDDIYLRLPPGDAASLQSKPGSSARR